MDIGRTTTKPGQALRIRIRGTRSLTASNDPLVVLDGVPFVGSLSDISPDDIKSLDVLKDASATAIYGSRGANGVILVTTNRGSKGQKARLSYNTYTGFQTLFSKWPMMNGSEFAKLREYAGIYTNTAGFESNDTDTDWQDLYYRVGMMTNHNLGITGGTEGGNYAVGLSYFKQEAVVPLQYYERYNLRAALDQKINNYLTIGFSTNNIFGVSNAMGMSAAATVGYSPLANPYNEDGTLKERGTFANLDQTYIYTRENLEKLGDSYIDQTRTFATYNNVYGELSIPWIQGLKYKLNVGVDYRVSNSGNYTGRGVFNYNEETVSSAGIGNSQTLHWLVENLLTYDRTFGKHKINLTGLYSAEQNSYNSSYISAKDIPLDAFQFYNLGHAQGEITIDPDNQGYYKTGLMSWMARAMYQYDNRYMITATVRSDAASVLAPGHQWHTYPAVSVGWSLHNEAFMEKFSFISQFKLRAGYGETSNQAVGAYSTLGRLTTSPYNFGDTYVIGNYVSTLPNPDLGWEYSETQNYGVDFGFFNNRLTGTVEYYITDTKDILLSKNLPTTNGVSSVVTNIGQTQNKGLEITLNGTIIKNENFTWDAGINFSANRNKLVALNDGQDRDESNLWFVGHSINALYDYVYVGLWQEGDAYMSILEPGDAEDVIGSIKVLYTGGYNEDGTPVRAINADDRQIIDTDPDWTGGFTTRLAYKNFDLNIVGAYQHGGVLISTLYGSASYLNRLTGRGNNVDVDYWTEDNTGARYPRPGKHLSGDNPKYGSTLALFDGSFAKIRAITLGYNFDRNVLESLNLTNMRLYATVQNPFVFASPYYRETGMDPEPNSTGDANQAVTSYKNRQLVIGTNNPSTRNFLIGLNVTF